MSTPELRFQAAKQFLRAGGVVTWSEWQGMSIDDKAAFCEAGDSLARDRAALPAQDALRGLDDLKVGGALEAACDAAQGLYDVGGSCEP